MSFENITDFYVFTGDIQRSVAFPGPRKFSDLSASDVAVLETIKTELVRLGEDGNDPRFKLKAGKYIFRAQKVSPGQYAVRWIPTKVMKFNELGLRQDVVDHLLSPELSKGGIILICGQPGQGKTTTAVTIVIERLKKFGGYCLTVEDPPEYSLEGFHGDGYCVQKDANGQVNIALVDALRCFPSRTKSILFFGEIRESFEASLLLKMALCGHLIVATIHGSSAIAGLKRMSDLALLIDASASYNLSEVLRLVLHQTIEGDYLATTMIEGNSKVRHAILNNNISGLSSETRISASISNK